MQGWIVVVETFVKHENVSLTASEEGFECFVLRRRTGVVFVDLLPSVVTIILGSFVNAAYPVATHKQLPAYRHVFNHVMFVC